MSEKLSVIRIVICREVGDLFQFPHIMECSCREQQITVQVCILTAVIITQLHHREGMLTQSAHKAVVNGLGRGMLAEGTLECGILEILVNQYPEPLVLHGSQNLCELRVHGLDIFFTDRKIVFRQILTCTRDPDSLDVQLQVILETGDLADHIDIIQRSEFLYSRGIRIPDLAVDRSGLVLERYVFIFLSRLRGCALSLSAQINASNLISLSQRLNVLHLYVLPNQEQLRS